MGGRGYFGYYSPVDVIDTSANGKQCASVQDFPILIQSMVASFYQGKVFTCGGENEDAKQDACFVMDDTLIWQPFDPLPYGLSDAASSNIGDFWWITGGRPESEFYYRDNATFIFDGTEFSEGPFLPYGMESHCQLTVNDTHVFLYEGKFSNAFMFNWDTQEWIFLERIPDPLRVGACGLLSNPNFGPEILVAEDYTSYIFNLADGQWREGPTPPVDISYPNYAQLEDGFIVTNVNNIGDVSTRNTYVFSDAIYEWVKWDDELEIAREFSAALAVPEDFLHCN